MVFKYEDGAFLWSQITSVRRASNNTNFIVRLKTGQDIELLQYQIRDASGMPYTMDNFIDEWEKRISETHSCHCNE
jgi:hypothetical protein